MSMEDELEERGRRAYGQRSTEEQKVRADAVTKVADEKTAEQALGVGETVPEFRLPSITGPVADSRELLSRGPPGHLLLSRRLVPLLQHRAASAAGQSGNGNDVFAYNGADVAEVPLPATYVAGADGIVRYAFADADYTRRPGPGVILAVLHALAGGSGASRARPGQ
jgi:hypothetical protein